MVARLIVDGMMVKLCVSWPNPLTDTIESFFMKSCKENICWLINEHDFSVTFGGDGDESCHQLEASLAIKTERTNGII